MTPILRARARAAATQLREDVGTVAPSVKELLRVTGWHLLSLSKTLAYRAKGAWQDAVTTPDVRRIRQAREYARSIR